MTRRGKQGFFRNFSFTKKKKGIEKDSIFVSKEWEAYYPLEVLPPTSPEEKASLIRGDAVYIQWGVIKKTAKCRKKGKSVSDKEGGERYRQSRQIWRRGKPAPRSGKGRGGKRAPVVGMRISTNRELSSDIWGGQPHRSKRKGEGTLGGGLFQ